MDDERKSVWEGDISFGGLSLRVHVLDDGTRVIEQESMERFCAWLCDGEEPDHEALENFALHFATFYHGHGIPQ